jgi:hypoxanthine phosphoribosyltransferase
VRAVNHLHVNWDEYHRLIEGLALQVDSSGWTFDAVICLARGGLRVGDILSRVFERPLGVLFTSSYREAGGTEQGRLIIGEQIASASPLGGGRWLLVDDLADSGDSLREALAVLKERHPEVEEIRSAVLWLKGCSRFTPDYHVQFLPDSPWIHQPFELYDRLRVQDLPARQK